MTINEYDECKLVENKSADKDVFIPTKTSNEWTLFKSNKPSYVDIADCSALATAAGGSSSFCSSGCYFYWNGEWLCSSDKLNCYALAECSGVIDCITGAATTILSTGAVAIASAYGTVYTVYSIINDNVVDPVYSYITETVTTVINAIGDTFSSWF